MFSKVITLFLGVSLLLVNVALAAPQLGAYWPAYGEQSPTAVAWKYIDIGYYFVTPTTRTGFEIPADQSESDLKAFVASGHANSRKILFSIGGWTGSVYFSDRIATSGNRSAFVSAIKSFMTKYGFDGVDLDFEYPNAQGIGCNRIRSSDATNYLAFLKTLRSAIGTGKMITAAVSANGIIGADGNVVNMAPYATYIDIFNLMTYDIGGPWSPVTSPNSPLRTCKSDTSVEQVVALFKSKGVPANRMMLGIPSYGYSFTTKSSTLATQTINGYSSKVYQAKTSVTPKGPNGDSNAAQTDVCGVTTTGYSGNWEYKQLIEQRILASNGSIGINGWTRYFDACTQTPFLFNPRTRVMINYEDSTSAGQKAAYAKSQGLRGAFIFSSDGFNNAVLANIKSRLGA